MFNHLKLEDDLGKQLAQLRRGGRDGRVVAALVRVSVVSLVVTTTLVPVSLLKAKILTSDS